MRISGVLPVKPLYKAVSTILRLNAKTRQLPILDFCAVNSIEADTDVDGDGLLNDVDTDDDNDGTDDLSDPSPLGSMNLFSGIIRYERFCELSVVVVQTSMPLVVIAFHPLEVGFQSDLFAGCANAFRVAGLF